MSTHFSERIPEMLIGQYRESPILVSFIQAMAFEADKLRDEIENVKLNRYLLNASGVQLDILGNILGIDREVVDFIDLIYFGYDIDATSLSLGDLEDASVGGRYRAADENPVAARRLIDSEYRALLFAKISKNSSDITPDKVLELTKNILEIMFSGEEISVAINETGNASFEIQIGAALSGPNQAFIADLDIIPRPTGVRISYLYTAPSNAILGEDGLTLFTEDNLQLEIE